MSAVKEREESTCILVWGLGMRMVKSFTKVENTWERVVFMTKVQQFCVGYDKSELVCNQVEALKQMSLEPTLN